MSRVVFDPFEEKAEGRFLVQFEAMFGEIWETSEFLRLAGGGNRERGGRRLAAWRSGDRLPTQRQLERIGQGKLRQDGELMSAFAAESAARTWNSRDPIERWTTHLQRTHARLLGERLSFLLGHRQQVLSAPALWMSKPQNGALGLAYIGGGRPPIGLLLEAWERGDLKLPCECGGEVHVWFASGSPLSGSHSLAGGCPVCGTWSQPSLVGSGRTTAGFIGPVLKGVDRSLLVEEHKSALPFELIDSFMEGDEVVVRGFDPESGDIVLEYDYRNGLLHVSSDEAENSERPSCEWGVSDLSGSGAGWSTSRFKGIYGVKQHVLRSQVDGVGTVLVGVAANRICGRGRGCVAVLDGRLPKHVVEDWACRSGVLAEAIAAARASS